MKLRIVLVAALAIALGGCGSDKWNMGKDPDPKTPVVSVKDGKIAVAPEPLKFAKDQKEFQIVWTMPTKSSRFAENGIVIDGEIMKDGSINKDQNEIVRCGPVKGDGTQFACLNRHTRPGNYKYTIRVIEDGRALPPFDPTIMNG